MSTDGRVYDRVAMTWVTPAQKARWDAEREERVFLRKSNQGQLCAPVVIRDGQGGIHGVQSMVDGKFYDSKSNMRRHYRERGFIEIGNDSSMTPEGIRSYRQPGKRLKSQAEKDAKTAEILSDVRYAVSQVNLTQHRKNEIT